jgi:hypothetical protein
MNENSSSSSGMTMRDVTTTAISLYSHPGTAIVQNMLTFCPPGPEARRNRSSSASSGMGGMRAMAGRYSAPRCEAHARPFLANRS